MNPEFSQNERAKLEAKLTALLLGELHADEIAALSQAMEADPELAALYERLKVTIELVREGAMQPNAGEQALKLSADKREKLLASFKTVAPEEFAKPRRAMDWLVPMAACAAVLVVVGAMFLPSLSRAKYKARRAYAGRYWGEPQLANNADSSSPAAPAVQHQAAATIYYGPVSRGGEVAATAPRERATAAPVASPAMTFSSALQTRNNLSVAPAAPMPGRNTSTSIVLPAEPGDAGAVPGQTVAGYNARIPIDYAATSDISEALNQLGSSRTNAVALNTWSAEMPKDAKQVMEVGTLKPETVAAGVVYTTNLSAALNYDTFQTNASDKTLAALSGTVIQNMGTSKALNDLYDRAVSNKAPVLADVPMLRSLFKSDESQRTQRAQRTNGGALAWGSHDGATNPGAAGYNLGVAGTDTYADGPIVNNGTLAAASATNWVQDLDVGDIAAASNSPAFVGRYAFVDKPSRYNEVITLGPQTPTHAGGVIQGENRSQNSILTARIGSQALNDESGKDVTRGGFGGGFGGRSGGFRGGGDSEPVLAPRSQQANGGKQVELAVAANAQASSSADKSQLKTTTLNVDPVVLYAGLQNVGTINFGAATNTSSEASRTPSVAGVDSTTSGGGRGLRYVTGLDPGIETQLATREFLRAAGVNLDSGGKSVFFNDRQGTLTVRGTEEDFAKIQALLNTLNASKPDMTVNTKFAEVSSNDSRELVDARNVTSMDRLAQVETAWGDNDARLKVPPQTPWSISSTNKIAEYAAANEQLERAKKWREVIALKTEQEKTELNLPRARMVTIMDPASAASTEKRSLGQKIKETLTGKVERVASIQVEQERPDINMNGIQGNTGSSYDPYFLLTEFETIQSDAVLGKVVKKLKLDGGDKSKTQAAEEQLKKSLDLHSVKNTKFIEIGARSEKAEDAARIANAVADAYREYRSEQYDELKNGGIQNLQQQLQDQDQKIVALQSNVDEMRKGLGDIAQQKTSEKLNSIIFDKVPFTRLPLNEVLRLLAQQTLRRDIDQEGVNFILNRSATDKDLSEVTVSLAPGITNASLKDLLKAIVKGADHPISYKMLDQGVEFSFQDSTNSKLDVAPLKASVPPPTPQPEVLTRENAFSTFSLNVSDVSFKLAAASLEKGEMPEPGSIRSEEFINAFDYRDPDAAPGVPIAFASERARYPFAHNRELLRFSLKTAAAGRQPGRPLNIVLLLDNSGSMERADRVGIIREALRVLAGQLQAGDTFSIVTFARTAQLRVDGIPGNQAGAAAEEIAKLTPEGGTNLGEALQLAYETARHHYLPKGDNRVVLLTDGAANLGDVNPDALKQKVEGQRQQGIALDCFGIGWEGYNDDLLEVLTRNGDGRYGFINSPAEANTEFVAQIAGALHVAAADVKVQVEFNTNRVTLYRQIGYAKHQLTKEQFRDNTVDAAEIAAQEAGNALYTIEINPEGSGSIATVRVRYKVPGTAEYREQAWDVPYTGGAAALDQASPAMRLVATACAFSEWLATSPFAAEVSTDQLLKYMNGVPQFYGADERPAKLEGMIRQAKSISGK